MADRIQIRRVYTANWNGETPLVGELALETDASPPKLRAGDGSTAGGRLVGAAAVQIGTRAISTATPDDGDTLVYDQASNTFVYAPGGGGGGGAADPTVTDLGNVNSATVLTVDASKGYKCVATGNLSFSFTLSGLTSTTEYRVSLQVTQDGTGGRTLVFTGTNVDAPGALLTVPIASGASKKSLVEFRVHNSRVELVNVVMDLRNS